MMVRFTAPNVVAMILFIPLLLALGVILAFIVPLLALMVAVAGIVFLCLFTFAKMGLVRREQLSGKENKKGHAKEGVSKAVIEVKKYKVR